MRSKDLLGIELLTREEIAAILDQAGIFRRMLDKSIPIKPALRGKRIVNLFFEPSSKRTATSFCLAARQLFASSVLVLPTQSVLPKSETLPDLARHIETIGADGVVVRHALAGVPHILAQRLRAFVINAGDGFHEHPTQALLDVFALQQRTGRIQGLKILILGDIAHSGVARSDIFAFTRLGAKVYLCAPPTLIPSKIEALWSEVFCQLDHILAEVDVVRVLRPRPELQNGLLVPSRREYRRLYCLTHQRLSQARHDLVVLHSGAVKGGIEMDAEVANSPGAVVPDQVTGVALCMAVLYLLAGRHDREG